MPESSPSTARPAAPPPSSSTGGASVPPPPLYNPDADVHILDRLAVLYRYRRIAIAVFVLASAAMMIQGYSTEKIYRAQARLLIEDERSTAVPGVTPDNFYEDADLYYKTQYRILKGRDLTRRVVAKLNLGAVPEFNGTAEPPSTPATMLRDAEKWLVRKIKPAPAEPIEAQKADETPDEASLVNAFISRVGVEPVTGSKLVDITFDSMDPKFAKVAIDTLADEYVEQNLALKQQSTQNMIDWLDKELERQQKKTEESERALADYRERQNALSLDEKQNIVLARLNKLNDDVMLARSKRAQRQAVYDQLKSLGSEQHLDTIPIIAQNGDVALAKGKLTAAQTERVRTAERYGEKHPNMQKATADVAEAQRQYDLAVNRAASAIKNEFETAQLEEQAYARSLESAKADAQDLSKKSVDYNVMEREARTNRDIFQSLMTREKELRVSNNSRQNNVRVVDHAEIPGGPLTPTGRRTWLLSLAVGL